MKDLFSVEGKIALVTGGGSGIGTMIARGLVEAGAKVYIASRKKDVCDEVAAELSGFGECIGLAADLQKPEECVRLAEEIRSREGRLDILVNNAAGPPGGPLLDNDVADFEAPFKRHLHAAHQITRMVVPAMEEAGTGRIVNIISTSVREPIPNIGLSNTLRGAMASWAKSLSRELPSCITINNILPGFTDTDRLGSLAASIEEKTGRSQEDIHNTWMSQVPIGRLIDPAETASAITFLCLPQSGGIRGVSLAVDGGRMRSI